MSTGYDANRPIPARHPFPESATTSAHETFDKLEEAVQTEVVPGGEHHQRQHQGQADAEAEFLRLLAERLTTNRLGGVEQQVTAVKDRNREQIDQPETDRQ